MTTIITRLYEDRSVAGEVIARLERRGFGELDHDLVALEDTPAAAAETPPWEDAAGSPPPADQGDGEGDVEAGAVEEILADVPPEAAPPAPRSAAVDETIRDSLARQLAASGVGRDVAIAAFDPILAGRALVVVRAPFGFATLADEILASFPAVEGVLPRARAYRPAVGHARTMDGPLPSLLPPGSLFMTGPVSGSVIRKPEPFERSFGVGLIIKESRRRGRAVIPDRPPFSAIVPIPLLFRRRMRAVPRSAGDPPFSAMLRLPLLIDRDRRRPA